ncbi:MAG: hypothetical protein ACU0DI_11460 [Paracoccaceae bacterium]
MDEKPKYPGITHMAVKVKETAVTEDFVINHGDTPQPAGAET